MQKLERRLLRADSRAIGTQTPRRIYENVPTAWAEQEAAAGPAVALAGCGDARGLGPTSFLEHK